jgi:hypothetical protein
LEAFSAGEKTNAHTMESVKTLTTIDLNETQFSLRSLLSALLTSTGHSPTRMYDDESMAMPQSDINM